MKEKAYLYYNSSGKIYGFTFNKEEGDIFHRDRPSLKRVVAKLKEEQMFMLYNERRDNYINAMYTSPYFKKKYEYDIVAYTSDELNYAYKITMEKLSPYKTEVFPEEVSGYHIYIRGADIRFKLETVTDTILSKLLIKDDYGTLYNNLQYDMMIMNMLHRKTSR